MSKFKNELEQTSFSCALPTT